jgi:hypothetical protein
MRHNFDLEKDKKIGRKKLEQKKLRRQQSKNGRRSRV